MRDIEVNGGSSVLDVSDRRVGAHVYRASAAGMTARIVNHRVRQTVAPDFVGDNSSAISFLNIAAVIDNCPVSLTSQFPVGVGPGGYPLAIYQGRPGSALEADIGGSKIINCRGVLNACNGGALFRMGNDLARRTLAADCEIGHCSGEGDAHFTAGNGHSIWAVNCLRPWVHHVEANIGALGLVDKGNLDGVFEDFIVRRHTLTYILNKGSINSVYRRFSLHADAGYAGCMVSYSLGDENNAGIWGTGAFSDGYFEIDGAENIILVNVPAGAGFSMTGCRFNLMSGSLSRYPFRIDGVNYPTFAAFSAAYPDNSANFP